MTKLKVSKIFKSHYKALLFLFLTWGIYFTILWPKMLYFNQVGDLVAGWRIIWADWAMHIGQINAFYYNPLIEVFKSHPLFAGIPLRYSFATNLFSSFLMKLGLDLVQATIIPSLVFSYLLLIALYFFLYQITRNKTQIIITINLFLLSGGLGFYHFFVNLSRGFSLSKFTYPPTEYTRIDNLGYYWYNTLVANFIPQRAFLPGIVLTLFILAYFYRLYQNNFSSQNAFKQLVLLGLLTGLLTFVHIHSLILIFFVCLFLIVVETVSFLFHLKKNQKLIPSLITFVHPWFIYAISVLISSLPFVIFFRIFNSSSYFRFYPGWLANSQSLNMPYIIFWLKNWGLLIPLALVSYFSVLSKNNPKRNLFILSFFFIFIACNLFIFQPYDWDNAKLLLWVYLIFSLLVSKLIYKLFYYFQKLPIIQIWPSCQNKTFCLPRFISSFILKLLAVIIYLSLTLSGTLDLIRILNTTKNSYTMIKASDIKLAQDYREISSYQDIALIPDTHLHWLPVMSGRRVFTGFSGWLWSWGIDYHDRLPQTTMMFQNSPRGRQYLKDNSIDYVILDYQTQEKYWSDEIYFNTYFEKVLENSEYQVYRISNL